jgi:hypothetical protein
LAKKSTELGQKEVKSLADKATAVIERLPAVDPRVSLSDRVTRLNQVGWKTLGDIAAFPGELHNMAARGMAGLVGGSAEHITTDYPDQIRESLASQGRTPTGGPRDWTEAVTSGLLQATTEAASSGLGAMTIGAAANITAKAKGAIRGAVGSRAPGSPARVAGPDTPSPLDMTTNNMVPPSPRALREQSRAWREEGRQEGRGHIGSQPERAAPEASWPTERVDPETLNLHRTAHRRRNELRPGDPEPIDVSPEVLRRNTDLPEEYVQAVEAAQARRPALSASTTGSAARIAAEPEIPLGPARPDVTDSSLQALSSPALRERQVRSNVLLDRLEGGDNVNFDLMARSERQQLATAQDEYSALRAERTRRWEARPSVQRRIRQAQYRGQERPQMPDDLRELDMTDALRDSESSLAERAAGTTRRQSASDEATARLTASERERLGPVNEPHVSLLERTTGVRSPHSERRSVRAERQELHDYLDSHPDAAARVRDAQDALPGGVLARRGEAGRLAQQRRARGMAEHEQRQGIPESVDDWELPQTLEQRAGAERQVAHETEELMPDFEGTIDDAISDFDEIDQAYRLESADSLAASRHADDLESIADISELPLDDPGLLEFRARQAEVESYRAPDTPADTARRQRAMERTEALEARHNNPRPDLDPQESYRAPDTPADTARRQRAMERDRTLRFSQPQGLEVTGSGRQTQLDGIGVYGRGDSQRRARRSRRDPVFREQLEELRRAREDSLANRATHADEAWDDHLDHIAEGRPSTHGRAGPLSENPLEADMDQSTRMVSGDLDDRAAERAGERDSLYNIDLDTLPESERRFNHHRRQGTADSAVPDWATPLATKTRGKPLGGKK